jgi:basic membrane protein A
MKKFRKNWLVLLLVIVMVVFVGASCSPSGEGESDTNQEPTAGEESEGTDTNTGTDADTGTDANAGESIRVAFVASGMLGDKSVNDNVWAGIEKAKTEFGVETKVLESNETADWDSNMVAMAEEGYDLIIAWSQLTETIQRIAGDYPDVKFALIDSEVDAPNVASLIFAQNEGSFLVGAAASIFTTQTDIEGVNADKKIGFIGGMDIPVIHDFLKGYEQGAKHVDPDTEVVASYAGSFNDPIKGKEVAEAQYSQDVDIIFNLGATSGIGVYEAMNDAGKFAIGGDVNDDPVYPGRVLISELKRSDVAAYEMIKAVVEGSWVGGIVPMNLKNGGMDVSDMSVMRESLGEKFPEAIPEKVQELKEQIINGEIKVDHEEGFTV